MLTVLGAGTSTTDGCVRKATSGPAPKRLHDKNHGGVLGLLPFLLLIHTQEKAGQWSVCEHQSQGMHGSWPS